MHLSAAQWRALELLDRGPIRSSDLLRYRIQGRVISILHEYGFTRLQQRPPVWVITADGQAALRERPRMYKILVDLMHNQS